MITDGKLSLLIEEEVGIKDLLGRVKKPLICRVSQARNTSDIKQQATKNHIDALEKNI